jgi:hypothetical protein
VPFTNVVRDIKPKRMRWAGHVTRMGEMRNARKILFRRPRRRWEGIIRIDIMEIGWEGVD